MTSRERVLGAIARQPVDYVPCSPFLNPQSPDQRVGKRWQWPCGPTQKERVSYFVEQEGADMVVSVEWQGSFPEEGVSSRVYMEGNTIHKVWSTPSGDLHAAVVYEENWPHGMDIPLASDYNIGRLSEPWIRTHRDIDCLRHILRPPRTAAQLERLRFSYRQARELADRYNLATVLNDGRGLTGAHSLFDTEQLCFAAVDEPELVDAYLEIEHERTMKSYEIAIDLGVDIVRRNGFYETCDFFSPQMLSRFLTARLREEVKLVHDAGRVVGYTCLTGYGPMLDHLADVGFDCLVVPDPFFHSSDPVRLQERLGGSSSFWTGPSDTIHMPWEDPEKVRAAMRRVFEVFGKQGLLISPCSSGKAVHPWSTTAAMLEEWRKLR